MSREYGAQNMVGRLRKVVVRRPDEAMAAADPAAWHYTSAIDLPAAQAAHDAFMSILKDEGVELLYHDEPLPAALRLGLRLRPRADDRRRRAGPAHGQGAAPR